MCAGEQHTALPRENPNGHFQTHQPMGISPRFSTKPDASAWRLMRLQHLLAGQRQVRAWRLRVGSGRRQVFRFPPAGRNSWRVPLLQYGKNVHTTFGLGIPMRNLKFNRIAQQQKRQRVNPYTSESELHLFRRPVVVLAAVVRELSPREAVYGLGYRF